MWVKVHDQLPNDPDIDELSDGAFRLYISALCFAQAELTDGHIPSARIRRLTPNYRPAHLQELTEDNGHPDGPIFLPVDDGYTIRNFTKYQKSRTYWVDKRQKDADRLARWRAEREEQAS